MHGHHEVFARLTLNREWDVSELSFAKFAAQVSREDRDIIGLPVICSRLFRFSSFYVNKNSGIKNVEDLKGKKIGSPEWAHSAAVYMRGWMHERHGREAEGRALVSSRRQRSRPRGEGRARPARGAAHPHRRQVTERDARFGRDRLRDHRSSADVLPRRSSRRRASLSRLPRDGRRLLQRHPHLADHAYHRDAEAYPRG